MATTPTKAGSYSIKASYEDDTQLASSAASFTAVLRRYVELIIDKATAQGLNVNDSGKIVYYENGKLFTGTKTIDGTTYRFGNDGICTKIDATIPEKLWDSMVSKTRTRYLLARS